MGFFSLSERDASERVRDEMVCELLSIELSLDAVEDEREGSIASQDVPESVELSERSTGRREEEVPQSRQLGTEVVVDVPENECKSGEKDSRPVESPINRIQSGQSVGQEDDREVDDSVTDLEYDRDLDEQVDRVGSQSISDQRHDVRRRFFRFQDLDDQEEDKQS